jgi:hypothetical protein
VNANNPLHKAYEALVKAVEENPSVNRKAVAAKYGKQYANIYQYAERHELPWPKGPGERKGKSGGRPKSKGVEAIPVPSERRQDRVSLSVPFKSLVDMFVERRNEIRLNRDAVKQALTQEQWDRLRIAVADAHINKGIVTTTGKSSSLDRTEDHWDAKPGG